MAHDTVHDVIPLSPYLPAPSAANFHAVATWQSALNQALFHTLRRIIFRANHAVQIDGDSTMTGPLIMASFTVATVPAAAEYTAGMIFVTDEVGGATPAFSDGTNWRRTADRAIIA